MLQGIFIYLDCLRCSDGSPAPIHRFGDDDVGIRLGEEVLVVELVSLDSEGEGVALHVCVCSKLEPLQNCMTEVTSVVSRPDNCYRAPVTQRFKSLVRRLSTLTPRHYG